MSKSDHQSLSMDELKTRLAGLSGRRYWRSLEELADSEAFHRLVETKLPQASALAHNISRRDFLRLMSASLALAGLGACAGEPVEEILPFVQSSEERMPGKPVYYATAFPLSGFATGVLVENFEGRPIKIEGNPQHPASLGATSAFAQAAVLELYDPERSQVVLQAGHISTWQAFARAVSAQIEVQRGTNGAGLRIMTGPITSPTLSRQLRALLQNYPQAKWIPYDPVNRDQTGAGALLSFGTDADTIYRFDKAEVILALDADFLFTNPGSLRYARDFASRRRIHGERARMNRLYVVEPTPTITGAMADHRLALPASRVAAFAESLARRLGIRADDDTKAAAPGEAWIEPLATDLLEHRGASVVTAGDGQPAEVHRLVHEINQRLGNIGSTVVYIEPAVERIPGRQESLAELVREMSQGSVDTLFILDSNPVFNAPADVNFAEALAQVRFRAHLGLYVDETAAACQWHVPELHFLESWSDARSYDGTATILQPLIAPLYGGRSIHQMIALLDGQPEISVRDLVRDFWKGRMSETDFEKWWQQALYDGIVPGTGAPAKSVSLKSKSAAAQPEPQSTSSSQSYEIVFREDPSIYDGRYANNAWLQELPKPITKLTWDNAALISPRTAATLGLKNGDAVELSVDKRALVAPVWVTPGQADESVTVHLGYGRSRVGRVGLGAGFNAYPLRTLEHPWFQRGLQIKKTGDHFELATTQEHHRMEGRDLVRTGTLEHYRQHPEFVHEMGHEPPPDLTLYPKMPVQEGHAWAMAIDTNVCIGCNACVIACQAENNIPVVGKPEVIRGREMHWLRVDRYYQGRADNPDILYQPVPCMHCENAPCETVCPVGATVHSSEGLNDMVYNRCVGTRYCSNNCPYKVRRFNFYQYADYNTEVRKLGYNPEVTVRSRGVMEKCTYCVQRINNARIEAKKENRPIRDGEVVTACQQACPTQAIIFGDIKDREAAVSRLKEQPLNYTLLAELNTRPRTSYLARLKNPNPKIAEE